MEAVEIVFSFADEDQEYYHKISEQLGPWKHREQLCCWSRLDVQVGQLIEEEVERHLEAAPLIVLLLSPEYLNSDHLYDVEAAIALRRQKAGQAQIVPVLARPCNYQATEFSKLKILPTNTRPISLWERRDQAFSEIAKDIGKLLEHTPAIEASKNQHQPWDLPYPRNPLFTGREAELQTIADALRAGQNAAIGQAISGLGGIGKTQTALEYAYRHRDEYCYVFWVIADTRDTLNTAYSRLAEQLDLPGKSLAEQRLVVEAVKSWLAAHNGWLLILDNADDLAIIPDYLPASIPGHLLLTTRARALGRLAQRVEIKRLNADEGSRFLLRRCGLLGRDEPLERADPNDLAVAREIVSELAGLPLALDQAAAYIEETSCGLPAYLDLYRAHHAELLQARGGLVADHPEPVATTWQFSFGRVEQANPGAADLLRLCAFLAPDDIPEFIITEGAIELTPPLQPLAGSPLKLNAAIAELQKYSLIERAPAKKTLSVHRLVQLALRDAMPPAIERAWAERTVRALKLLFPWPKVENWETRRQLLPHGQACAALIEQWQMESVEGAWLLSYVGEYLLQHASYQEAQLYYEKAVAIEQKVLGEENLATLTSLGNLASLYQEQGKYDNALALHQQVLAIQRKVLGEQHPDTATSLHNLAIVYHEQGKYNDALALYQQALAITRKVLGEQHPDTAMSLNNVAFTYYEQKKYKEAEDLGKQALEIKRKILENTHPSIARSLDTLACVYKGQERYAEALPLFKEAWVILRERLGSEHPDTKTTQRNYEETRRLMEEKEQGGQDV